MVYNTKTQKKNMFTKEGVLDFKLSNNKEQLAIVIYNEKKNINELKIMNLDGTNKKIIAEESINSIDWSKDGNEIAYTSYDEDDESGVYTVDTNTGEKN